MATVATIRPGWESDLYATRIAQRNGVLRGAGAHLMFLRAPNSQRHKPSSAPRSGTLTGRLVLAGGPAPGRTIPADGSVVVTGSGQSHVVQVGSDGRFTSELPPGTYMVTGTSAAFNDGMSVCQAQTKVTVIEGKTSDTGVLCPIR
jgi:hypothetical protein